MVAKTALAKVCDNRRQLCDNFATTEKQQKINDLLRNIYIYIEVVATFLVVSTPLFLPPLSGGFGFGWFLSIFPPLYCDNRKRQLFSDNLNPIVSVCFSRKLHYYFSGPIKEGL